MEPAASSLSAGGIALLQFEEVDSTNSEAMRRGLAGVMAPLWVVAERQTAGRGRSSRLWTSLPGNLSASLLLRLTCPVATAAQLSLVAGVAAVDAIRTAVPDVSGSVRLKWPNDLLIGTAKTGGILVESCCSGSTLIAVIGFGINLTSAPDGLGRSVTHLGAHGPAPPASVFLPVLAEAMSGWLARWNEGRGFAFVREAWVARAGALGEVLSVHSGQDSRSGRFAGLDADGSLLLAMGDGTIDRVAVGDVALAGGAPAGS